jgi:hypothetical protein
MDLNQDKTYMVKYFLEQREDIYWFENFILLRYVYTQRLIGPIQLKVNDIWKIYAVNVNRRHRQLTTFAFNIRQNLKSARLIVVCKRCLKQLKDCIICTYTAFFPGTFTTRTSLAVESNNNKNEKPQINKIWRCFSCGCEFQCGGYWETWKRCGQNVMFLVCPSSNKENLCRHEISSQRRKIVYQLIY